MGLSILPAMRRSTSGAWVVLLGLVSACGGGGGNGDGYGAGFLPSGVPDCPSTSLSFVISSGTLRTFEDPNAVPLIARVRVGEEVGLFLYPRVGGHCNSAFGPVQAWASTNRAVADVVPLSPGSSSATLTGLSSGEAVISATVLYPQEPPQTSLPARLMYYCCKPSDDPFPCPAAPPACRYAPIDRVRVVPP